MISKSLIIPYFENKILLQDRTGHKPPPWGFFGGSIEEGETPIEALIREVAEELTIVLPESEVTPLGKYIGGEIHRTMYVYTWHADVLNMDYKLEEGKGLKYVTLEEAKGLLSDSLDLKIISDLKGKIA